jgi:hypothetical protein
MEDGQTIYLSSSSFLPWSARDEKHFKMRIFGFWAGGRFVVMVRKHHYSSVEPINRSQLGNSEYFLLTVPPSVAIAKNSPIESSSRNSALRSLARREPQRC